MTNLDDAFPPRLSKAESIELRRRQKGRNWALLIALILIAGLFYAISMVKFKVS